MFNFILLIKIQNCWFQTLHQFHTANKLNKEPYDINLEDKPHKDKSGGVPREIKRMEYCEPKYKRPKNLGTKGDDHVAGFLDAS